LPQPLQRLRGSPASATRAGAERDAAVVLFIDEHQYVREEQLAALIGALHSASQDQLPITMMAAGLPQLVGQAGRAKSYAERLFEFVPMDRLDPEAAGAALRVPAAKSNVTFDDAAISEILAQTLGYPYFLQEWGKHSWNLTDCSPIRGNDARRATVQALAELDASFFRVRFDRLTPSEKRYLRPWPNSAGDLIARGTSPTVWGGGSRPSRRSGMC